MPVLLLQNKLIELETYCIENKIDLIAITETIPKENTPDKANIKFVSDGYTTGLQGIYYRVFGYLIRPQTNSASESVL